MYFESHAHYDDSRFDDDRDSLLGELLPEAGISTVINSGSTMASTFGGVKLAEKYPYIYAAAGVHPHYANKITDRNLAELEELTRHDKVVAIGEIGLDYYYDHSPRDIQTARFKEQLDIAVRTGLPVIIHSRDAAKETFDIIKEYSGQKLRGVVHCFGGSAEMAKEYVKLGFYLGIGGIVTFPKTKTLVEVVNQIGIDRLLIETDCPYLSPAPKRGQRNSSLNLSYIAEKISQIKQLTLNEVLEQTEQNGKDLFLI